MEVIYWCYAGAHTSVTAAALHLGFLNMKPTITDIMALPGFDSTCSDQLGMVNKYGTDTAGNNIYIAALGPNRAVTLPVLNLLLEACGLSSDSYLLVNALSCIRIETRVGGYISRRLGYVRLGRYLCALGILRSFKCFMQLVETVKAACTNSP